MSYVEDLFGLGGKAVVITGAGGAIAGVLAEAYLRAGAKVALWAHRPDEAAAVAERLEPCAPAPGSILALACDAGSKPEVEEAYDRTAAVLGPPDVLLNAAGGNKGKWPFVEMDLDKFEEILRLNLMAGLVVPTQVFATKWIAAGLAGRSVINMASMSSFVPMSGVWAYNAAKAGVLNLTMALANEFGSKGIRVNAIAPGFYLGKQNYDLLVADRESGALTDRGSKVVSRTPMGRFGELSELSGAALFLSSEKAAGFVTGISLPVDGGFLAENI